jgi:hypothetical protein
VAVLSAFVIFVDDDRVDAPPAPPVVAHALEVSKRAIDTEAMIWLRRMAVSVERMVGNRVVRLERAVNTTIMLVACGGKGEGGGSDGGWRLARPCRGAGRP